MLSGAPMQIDVDASEQAQMDAANVGSPPSGSLGYVNPLLSPDCNSSLACIAPLKLRPRTAAAGRGALCAANQCRRADRVDNCGHVDPVLHVFTVVEHNAGLWQSPAHPKRKRSCDSRDTFSCWHRWLRCQRAFAPQSR